MQKIKIERYDNPEAVGYQGYAEPEDRSWILYVELDGTPLFYPHRAEDGGVLCEGVGPHNTPQRGLPVDDAEELRRIAGMLAAGDPEWRRSLDEFLRRTSVVVAT